MPRSAKQALPAGAADDAPGISRPRRRHRGGRSHRPPEGPAAVAVEEPGATEEPAPEAEGKPLTRTQRRRVLRRRAAAKQVGAPPAAIQGPAPPLKAPARSRRQRPARKPREEAAPPPVPAPFVHPSEVEFARILDFYGIEWKYEPRSFPLRWEHGHVAEAFTPDFYLPEFNLYVELTTLKTGLTAEKNRKVRLLRQLYPEVNVKLLKKRDLFRLLTKYGYGPLGPEDVPDIDRILIPTGKLQQRVADLGAQISRDYAGCEPVLIGILRGVFCFLADLIRHVSVPVTVDFMAISSYEDGTAGAVKILKDLDENIKGRDVILVEDIVDTGMTLNHLLDYLWAKKPLSLRVCALLDKRVRRLTSVSLDYTGFEVPDEFVVGYGLDFRQRYRNLPFVAVLKHELLP